MPHHESGAAYSRRVSSIPTLLGLTADEWQALGTVVTALLTAGLLAYAIVQVGQAKKLRDDQTRPFVIVDVNFRSIVIELVIENIGATAATDVLVAFDTPLASTSRAPDWQHSSAFTDGVPMMAPRRRIRFFLDSYVTRDKSDLPMQITGTVSYYGPRRTQRSKPYSDPFVIDLSVYKGASVNEKGVPEMAAALEKMNRRFDSWTDGSRGLAVQASDSDKASIREDRPFHLREARNAARDGRRRDFAKHYVHLWRSRGGWYSR